MMFLKHTDPTFSNCLLASILLFCVFAKPGLAQDKVSLLATNYPPYGIEKSENDDRGFDVEVAEAAFKAVSMDAVVEFVPWARALRYVETGQSAGMLTCADTPERRKTSYLSNPVSEATSAFMTRQDYKGKQLSTLSDLKGMDVWAVRGYAYVDNLKKLGIEAKLVNSDVSLLKMLASKRIEAIIVGKQNIQYLAKKLKLGMTFKYSPIVDLPGADLFLCFSKKHPGAKELTAKFNGGLSIIKANGTYKAIHDKYR